MDVLHCAHTLQDYIIIYGVKIVIYKKGNPIQASQDFYCFQENNSVKVWIIIY